MCPGMARVSGFTSGTRQVPRVKYPVISHEREKGLGCDYHEWTIPLVICDTDKL